MKSIYRGVELSKHYTATSETGISTAIATKASTSSLASILLYQNQSVVARIAYDLRVSKEKAEEIFNDVKRFLFVASQSSGVVNFPPPVIDEGWHSFILFTQDYQSFCHEQLGIFIHHVPHTENDPPLELEDLHPTIDRVINLFGEIPSKNWNYINLAEQALN